MKKKRVAFALTAILMAAVAACAPGSFDLAVTPAASPPINAPTGSLQLNAPGPNPQVNTEDARGRVPGILAGIWHGIISPVTLVMSFINTEIQMYEVHNNGSQYNLGFLLGVAIVFVLLGATAGSRRR